MNMHPENERNIQFERLAVKVYCTKGNTNVVA
jgi:hypothetical protein